MAKRRIDEDGCWLWTGPIFGTGGYGRIGREYVHIVAYEIFHGERTPGLEILHACDKPLCFRPGCLSEGTHQKNMEDAATRGRLSGHTFKVTNKLTYEKAEEIRRRVKDGELQVALSIEFGVTARNISYIINNKVWKRKG